MIPLLELLAEDLTVDQLAKIFEAAFYETRPSQSDPRRIWIEDLRIYIYYSVGRSCIRFFGVRWSRKGRDELIALCNRINRGIAIVSVSCGEDRDDDGDYVLTLECCHVLYPGESISSKKLVKLARRVSESIECAINEYDDDSLLDGANGADGIEALSDSRIEQLVNEALRIDSDKNKIERMKGKYFELMAKRKALLFEGGHEEEAQKMLELAMEMSRRGMVSDDEALGGAYI